MSKLILGTAQFGMPYGVVNSQGQISVQSASQMISIARKYNINLIDTASNYGTAENVLGCIDVKDFKIITKISLPKNCDNLLSWVESQVDLSIQKLKIKKLYGLLIHNPWNLPFYNLHEVNNLISYLQDKQKVIKFGVSIYNPTDYFFLNYNFNIIQSPFNLVDNRLINSGLLKRLKDLNYEVHIRSIFLQGLLLQSPDLLPSKFMKWEYIWKRWAAWQKSVGISALHGCISYVSSFSEIDHIIVGVDSPSHFLDILNSHNKKKLSFPNLVCDDEMLINPFNWANL